MLRLVEICSKDPLDRPTFRAVVPLAVFCSNQWNFKKGRSFQLRSLSFLMCAKTFMRQVLPKMHSSQDRELQPGIMSLE